MLCGTRIAMFHDQIPNGDTLRANGKQAGSVAPVALRIERPPTCPRAIVMTVLAGEVRNATEKDGWPSRPEDQRTTWLVFDGPVQDAGEIHFRDGFWIAPSTNVPPSIAGTPFRQKTPLHTGADLSIGSARLRAEIYRPAAQPVPTNYAQARAK
jgi:hypothetical protein